MSMKELLVDKNIRENIKLAMLVESMVDVLRELETVEPDDWDDHDLRNQARQILKAYDDWLKAP